MNLLEAIPTKTVGVRMSGNVGVLACPTWNSEELKGIVLCALHPFYEVSVSSPRQEPMYTAKTELLAITAEARGSNMNVDEMKFLFLHRGKKPCYSQDRVVGHHHRGTEICAGTAQTLFEECHEVYAFCVCAGNMNVDEMKFLLVLRGKNPCYSTEICAGTAQTLFEECHDVCAFCVCAGNMNVDEMKFLFLHRGKNPCYSQDRVVGHHHRGTEICAGTAQTLFEECHDVYAFCVCAGNMNVDEMKFLFLHRGKNPCYSQDRVVGHHHRGTEICAGTAQTLFEECHDVYAFCTACPWPTLRPHSSPGTLVSSLAATRSPPSTTDYTHYTSDYSKQLYFVV
ncbi:hypothetical protein J6590_006356 [Homalodisca vitripennis]|nr:hypothetical protein J6590_006356 [Homalodisca vitripennis]